jgi:hypothetical protein
MPRIRPDHGQIAGSGGVVPVTTDQKVRVRVPSGARTQDTKRSVNGYRYSVPFEARTVAVITQTK